MATSSSPRGRGMSTGSSARTRPGRSLITLMRSESSTASRIEWVTKSTETRSRSQSRSSSSRSASRESSSRAPSGSSISSSRGPCTSARASATRCRMPPESSPGWWRANSAMPTRSSSACTSARTPASSAASRTLRSTESHGSSPGSCCTRPSQCSRRACAGCSPKTSASVPLDERSARPVWLPLLPDNGWRGSAGRASRRPAAMRSSVVLPQPEGPTSETNSPAPTSSAAPSSACTSPAGDA